MCCGRERALCLFCLVLLVSLGVTVLSRDLEMKFTASPVELRDFIACRSG